MVGAHLGFIEQRMPVLFVPHPGQRSQRLGCQEKRDLRTRQRCRRPFPQPPRLGVSHGTLTRAHVVLVRAPDLAEVSVHALRDVIDLVWHQLGSGRRTILGGPLLAGENMVSHLLVPLASQDVHACGTVQPGREEGGVGRAGWAQDMGTQGQASTRHSAGRARSRPQCRDQWLRSTARSSCVRRAPQGWPCRRAPGFPPPRQREESSGTHHEPAARGRRWSNPRP